MPFNPLALQTGPYNPLQYTLSWNDVANILKNIHIFLYFSKYLNQRKGQ